MGYCPDWYVLMSAARYLNVPPWELVKQPLYWTEWAINSQSAETQVEKDQQDRETAKMKRPAKRR